MITQNARLLFCSKDMHRFMEDNAINAIPELFYFEIDDLIQRPDFPYHLLEEWVRLRDRLIYLSEN